MLVDVPNVLVTVGALSVAGAVALRIEQPAFFRAARFSVTFVMGEPPLWGITEYATLAKQTLTIGMASAPLNFMPLITGQIDNVTIDCASSRATLTGRDLSARMIDTENAETFVNQTASDIAVAIAGRHGLAAEVTPTTAIVGQYYELDHARSALTLHSRVANEWDMLVWLAQNENYFVSVNGASLYFGPMPVRDPSGIFASQCIELSFDRALTLPGLVTVTSWNTRDKRAVTQTAGSGTAGTNLVKPNLSNTQALELARSHLASLSQHVTILDLKMPGELDLSPGAPIYLTGTNSELDQIYIIEEIVRELDVANGFVESIRAFAMN